MLSCLQGINKVKSVRWGLGLDSLFEMTKSLTKVVVVKNKSINHLIYFKNHAPSSYCGVEMCQIDSSMIPPNANIQGCKGEALNLPTEHQFRLPGLLLKKKPDPKGDPARLEFVQRVEGHSTRFEYNGHSFKSKRRLPTTLYCAMGGCLCKLKVSKGMQIDQFISPHSCENP